MAVVTAEEEEKKETKEVEVAAPVFSLDR